jgi:hypothetical protein
MWRVMVPLAGIDISRNVLFLLNFFFHASASSLDIDVV